jgi:hypothetical protein
MVLRARAQLLASLHDILIDYLPNPSRVTLFARNHNAEKPFRHCKRMAIAPIGEKDDSVCEARAEFGESEHDLVPVRRIDDDVELHLLAAESFSRWCSCALREFKDRDAFVGCARSPVVGNRHTLAWQRFKISGPQDQRPIDFSIDAQRRVRRIFYTLL